MNEKNIERIKGQLLSLGLPPEIEVDLRANICLLPDHFQVNFRQVRDMDIMNSVFYFEQKEDEYCCSYYEACLRKKIFAPEIMVNEIDIVELDERMSKVDWQSLKQHEEIENIITDLKKLSASPEGIQFADRLKIKFWMDTSLVFLIPNVAALKNQYEVAQRFYFFDGEEQISLDEAYRFLSHRWREKQLNARKKKDSDGTQISVGATTKNNKDLLKKRSKR